MGMHGLTAKGVPPQPKWLLIIKAVIVFLSVVILALSAYAISLTGGYGYYYGSGAAGFMIFIVSLTPLVRRKGRRDATRRAVEVYS